MYVLEFFVKYSFYLIYLNCNPSLEWQRKLVKENSD